MKNIFIPNQGAFDAKLGAIAGAGRDKLHVRMDFDGTITRAAVGGKRGSLVSILSDENLLGEAFSKEGSRLYEKYRPIEIDPSISIEDKKILMREWWDAIFGLMIENKLSKRHIEQVARNARIRLRAGFKDCVANLEQNNIPLVIMSAGGLGAEAIGAILQINGIPSNNIYVAGNRFEWDNNGQAAAVKEPIVHTLNKDEKTLRCFPEIRAAISGRSNVLLITDTIADATMADGADITNVLSFGFLNVEDEKQLESFKQTFDAILLNDAPMDFINEIVAEITGK